MSISTNYKIDIERLSFMKRWFLYVPDYWEMDKIVKKNSDELTSLEIKRLLLYKMGIDCVEKIDYFLAMPIDEEGFSKMSLDDQHNLNQFMETFDFEEMALRKIPADDVLKIDSIVSKYDGTNEKQLLAEIMGIADNEFTLKYAKGLLYRKVIGFGIKKQVAKHKATQKRIQRKPRHRFPMGFGDVKKKNV